MDFNEASIDLLSWLIRMNQQYDEAMVVQTPRNGQNELVTISTILMLSNIMSEHSSRSSTMQD